MKFKILTNNPNIEESEMILNIATYLEREKTIKSKQIFLIDIENQSFTKYLDGYKVFYMENDNVENSYVLRVDNCKMPILFIFIRKNEDSRLKKIIRKLKNEEVRKVIFKSSKFDFEKINNYFESIEQGDKNYVFS